jgi:hypothetical protein
MKVIGGESHQREALLRTGLPMQSITGPLFGLMLAILAVAMGGCASSPTSENQSCSSRLIFFEPGLPSTFYNTCEMDACGEPVNWRDVLVVNVDNEDQLDLIVATQAGPEARFNDQWYVTSKISGSGNDLRQAQRAFAARGCNLLILGGTEAMATVDSTFSGRRIRWGRY